MTSSNITIFHLSDIHVGEDGVSVNDLRIALDRIEKRARDTSSPLVVVTGDLTTEGLREEYEGIASAFDGFAIPSVIIPGNHDERNYGSAIFEEFFGERFKTYEDENIALFAADSAEPDNDAGHVGRVKYNEIRDFFNRSKDKVRIFALHHHLVPVPHTGREQNVVEDAGDVLAVLEGAKCSIVLNGHRHVPWVWKLGDMILCSTGTLLSKRVRGAATQLHSRIEIMDKHVLITLCQKDGIEKVFSKVSLNIL
ncbi:metallophosphoesterase [Candidatus Thorarchaeota archaeon]|nr:MAG: metallophosphoesterase [Candidatus Thorarchaeota archaeon]